MKPLNFSVLDDKLLLQVGNVLTKTGKSDPTLVFYKGGFSKKITGGLKTVFSESSFNPGNIDHLLDTPAKKKAYQIEIEEFANQFNSNYSLNFINKVIMGGVKILFFYDYAFQPTLRPDIPRPINKIYYSRARAIATPGQTEEKNENSQKGETDNPITFSQMPFFYDCSESVEYIDYVAYLASLNKWDDPTTQWDDSTTQWDQAASSYGFVSDLTDAQKKQYFTNLKSGGVRYFLRLRDRFFERDTTQTKRQYLFEDSVLSASSKDLVTTDALITAGANSDVFRVELSALAPGQSLKILNLSNGSGVEIIWRNAIAPTDELVYNSYYNKLFLGGDEANIPTADYAVRVPPEAAQPLYFTGLLDPFRVGLPDYEQVRLIATAGANLDVKLDILPAYD